jgi:HlyD family secretion protein
MRLKSIIITIIVLLAAAALVYFGYQTIGSQQANADEGLQTVVVERGTLRASVDATGSVVPETRLELNFESAGRVAEIMVEEGDQVEAGEVLARLDTADLEQALIQAQASLAISEAQLVQTEDGASAEDLASARAALESALADYEEVKDGPSQEDITVAKASMEKARIALEKAQADYDKISWQAGLGATAEAKALQQASVDYEGARAQYELTVDHPTDSELKQAAAQVAQAQATLATLEEQPTPEDLAIARAQVTQARSTLTQAQLNLEDATLLAPFAGTVADVNIEVGQIVNSGTPVIVLTDPTSYYVDLYIDETDIGQILNHQNGGQPAVITLDAFPDEEIEGKVIAIKSIGTVSGGIVTYEVRVEIAPTEVPAKPDMTASATVVVEEKENVLLIPNRAIRREGDVEYVEVLPSTSSGQRAGTEVRRVAIATGASNDTVTEVTGGLEEGDAVVTDVVRDTEFQGPMGMFGGGGE